MKEIQGYNGKYFADENGDIFSTRCKSGLKKLRPQLQSGYHGVDLGLNGVIKRHLVHRLVAAEFHPNPENKPQVNHLNGNKLDNRAVNLEWSTRSENQAHAVKIGLRHTRGEKNSQSKLNKEDVIEILNSKQAYKDLVLKYNVSTSTISDIKRGYSWTHVTGLKNLKAI